MRLGETDLRFPGCFREWSGKLVLLLLILGVAIIPPGMAQATTGAVGSENTPEMQVHYLLLARETAAMAAANREKLQQAVVFHEERRDLLQQRLLFARVEVDVRTRQAGVALEATDGGDAGTEAMLTLREAEQRVIQLFQLHERAQRQVELAKANLTQAQEEAADARKKLQVLEDQVKAGGHEQLLELIPQVQSDELRHVDICPYCRDRAQP